MSDQTSFSTVRACIIEEAFENVVLKLLNSYDHYKLTTGKAIRETYVAELEWERTNSPSLKSMNPQNLYGLARSCFFDPRNLKERGVSLDEQLVVSSVNRRALHLIVPHIPAEELHPIVKEAISKFAAKYYVNPNNLALNSD